MAPNREFDAVLQHMNAANRRAGPLLERIVDTDNMSCTVLGAEGNSVFIFDASEYMELARRTSAQDMPALVAHMLLCAKSFIANPQQDAQSKLAAATRRATQERPPTPAPPLGRPASWVLRRPGSWFGPSRSLCAGRRRGASCEAEDDCSRDKVAPGQG